MTEPTLTETERLLLVNQYSILEKLDPENAKYHSNLHKIVEDGYTIFYGEVFKNLSDPVSLEECQYVFDVLGMYRALHDGYKALTDKSGIDPEDVRFKGFDGNNEGRQLSLAEYLQSEGRWQESLKGDLNSHSMTEHQYRRMLERWMAVKEKHKRSYDWKPTKDEIKEIIS